MSFIEKIKNGLGAIARGENVAETKRALEGRIAELEGDLEESRTQHATTIRQKNDLGHELDAAKEGYVDLENRKIVLEGTLHMRDSELNKLTCRLKKVETALNFHDGAREKTTEVLEKGFASIASWAAGKDETTRNFADGLGRQFQDTSFVPNRVDLLVKLADGIRRREMDEANIKQCKAEFERVQLITNRNALESELSDAKKELNTERENCKKALYERDEARGELAREKVKSSQIQTAYTEAQTELACEKVKSSQIQTVYTEAQTELARVQAELDSTKQELGSTKKLLVKSEEGREFFYKSWSNSFRSLASAERQCNEATLRLLALQSELQAAQTELQAAQVELQSEVAEDTAMGQPAKRARNA